MAETAILEVRRGEAPSQMVARLRLAIERPSRRVAPPPGVVRQDTPADAKVLSGPPADAVAPPKAPSPAPILSVVIPRQAPTATIAAAGPP